MLRYQVLCSRWPFYFAAKRNILNYSNLARSYVELLKLIYSYLECYVRKNLYIYKSLIYGSGTVRELRTTTTVASTFIAIS